MVVNRWIFELKKEKKERRYLCTHRRADDFWLRKQTVNMFVHMCILAYLNITDVPIVSTYIYVHVAYLNVTDVSLIVAQTDTVYTYM